MLNLDILDAKTNLVSKKICPVSAHPTGLTHVVRIEVLKLSWGKYQKKPYDFAHVLQSEAGMFLIF
jgi:hypothetical protein